MLADASLDEAQNAARDLSRLGRENPVWNLLVVGAENVCRESSHGSSANRLCLENPSTGFMVRQMVNPRCDELEQIVEVNMQKLSRWVNPYPDSSGSC